MHFVTLCAAQGLQKRPRPQKRGGCGAWLWVTWRTPTGCAPPAGHMGQTHRGSFALTSSSRDWQKAARKSSFHPFTPCLQQQRKKETGERNGKRRWGHQSAVFLPHGGHPQTPLPRAHQQQEKSPRLLQHTLCWEIFTAGQEFIKALFEIQGGSSAATRFFSPGFLQLISPAPHVAAAFSGLQKASQL